VGDKALNNAVERFGCFRTPPCAVQCGGRPKVTNELILYIMQAIFQQVSSSATKKMGAASFSKMLLLSGWV